MRRLLPILATLILCGCGPNETSMEAHKPIADRMLWAPVIDVYEGVSRPRYSGNPFPWERDTEEATVKFGDHEFYETPLDVSVEDKAELTRLFSDVTMVRPIDLTVVSSCCGFHADYCLVWKSGSDTFYVLLSLRSGDIRAAGGDLELSMECDNGSQERLSDVLRPYRRHVDEFEEDVSTTVEPVDFPDPLGEYKRYGG